MHPNEESCTRGSLFSDGSICRRNTKSNGDYMIVNRGCTLGKYGERVEESYMMDSQLHIKLAFLALGWVLLATLTNECITIYLKLNKAFLQKVYLTKMKQHFIEPRLQGIINQALTSRHPPSPSPLPQVPSPTSHTSHCTSQSHSPHPNAR